MKYEAVCTSITCNGKEMFHVRDAKRKNVSINTSFCPDCQSALFWIELGKKSHYRTASNSVTMNKHKNYDGHRFRL